MTAVLWMNLSQQASGRCDSHSTALLWMKSSSQWTMWQSHDCLVVNEVTKLVDDVTITWLPCCEWSHQASRRCDSHMTAVLCDKCLLLINVLSCITICDHLSWSCWIYACNKLMTIVTYLKWTSYKTERVCVTISLIQYQRNPFNVKINFVFQ